METSVHEGASPLSDLERGILRTPQMENPLLVRPVRLPVYTMPSSSGTQSENKAGRPHHFQPKLKIELFTFDGKVARYWVRKCNCYFDYYSTAERDKIQIAALYFD